MIRFFFWTRQYSRSEVMLTFFERSPLDQVLRNDKVHRIQPCIQSPIKISGGWSRSLVGGATLHLDRSRWHQGWSGVFILLRNHEVQRILSGQHRNHCVWRQSPRREGQTLVHRFCRTFVSLMEFCGEAAGKKRIFFTTTFLLTFKVHTALKCEGHVGPPTHTGT